MNTVVENTINSMEILPNRNVSQQTIYLTNSKSAWLTITWLPDILITYSKNNFQQLFALHPNERGKVILHDEEINSQRWHKSYLNTPAYSAIHHHKSYMYAGKDANIDNSLPALFQPYLDEINKDEHDDKYNQVIVNWYANGNDYIAAHSDCQLFMKPNASIAILSLYENDEDYRILQFTPKRNADIDNDFIFQKLKIAALQGCIITMYGDTQQKFRHKIPKDIAINTSRISITCRKF